MFGIRCSIVHKMDSTGIAIANYIHTYDIITGYLANCYVQQNIHASVSC